MSISPPYLLMKEEEMTRNVKYRTYNFDFLQYLIKHTHTVGLLTDDSKNPERKERGRREEGERERSEYEYTHTILNSIKINGKHAEDEGGEGEGEGGRREGPTARGYRWNQGVGLGNHTDRGKGEKGLNKGQNKY